MKTQKMMPNTDANINMEEFVKSEEEQKEEQAQLEFEEIKEDTQDSQVGDGDCEFQNTNPLEEEASLENSIENIDVNVPEEDEYTEMTAEKNKEKEDPWAKWGDDPTIDYEKMSTKVNDCLAEFYSLMNKKA